MDTRYKQALEAKEAIPGDVYSGWETSDVELFKKYQVSFEPTQGYITDFMGIKIRNDFFPSAHHQHNQSVPYIPLPDDGLRAEAIEYFAILYALEKAPSHKFVMAEYGASFAPWACICHILALRTGRVPHITIVEAGEYFMGLIPAHFQSNNVDINAHDIRVIHGAVSSERGTLYFPKIGGGHENDGKAVSIDTTHDYVGRTVDHIAVEAYPIEDLLPGDITDLLHIDIQGAEYSAIASAISILNTKVRSIFIGTHSRLIEGQLIELLNANGWKLIREQPVKFNFRPDLQDITGWTVRDGGQLWINNRNL